MKLTPKTKYYLIIGLPLFVAILVFIYIKLYQQGSILCRRVGQTIAIGFNEEKVKCCKGLDAVIETKSNVRCSIHSESQGTDSDISRPRVLKLEQ
jgi:hypothetical protein